MADEQQDSMTTGSGPGDAPVGAGGIIGLAAYCIAAFLICGSALIELWPHPTPAGTPPKNDTSTSSATTTNPPPKGGGDSSAASRPGADGSVAGRPGADGSAVAGRPGADGSASANRPGAEGSAAANRPGAEGSSATNRPGADGSGSGQPETPCSDASSGCTACEKEASIRRGPPSTNGAQSNDPECVHLWWTWLVLWQEERLLLIVLLAGALGSLLHTVGSFTKYAGLRKLVMSWVPWYVLTPLVGAFLAAVFYLTIRGGFFSSNAPVSSTSPFGFAAVAALVGMFSKQATEKLRKIFDALFTSVPPGAEGVGDAPKPVLTDVTGTITHGQAAVVTLKGSGFTKTSKVHVGTKEVPTELLPDKQLKATIPVDLVPANAGDPITFTVVTPPPGGGTSEAKTVKVG